MQSILNELKRTRFYWGHFYAYKNLYHHVINLKKKRNFISRAELLLDTRSNFNFENSYVDILKKQKSFKQFFNFAEIIRVINELKKMDCAVCKISGGEPTKRNDLFDIISSIHFKEILPILKTNCYLIDQNYITELKKAGLFKITVPLYSSNSEIHNKISNKPDAFEKIEEAIHFAKQAKILFSISIEANHENIKNGELKKMVEFASKEKIQAMVSYPHKHNRDKEDYPHLLSKNELCKVRNIFNLANVENDFLKVRKMNECPAGRFHIIILPDGSVCPCAFIQISFGNILFEPLNKIMDRIWSGKIFMSRSSRCLMAESAVFNQYYLKPILKNETIPIYYKDHPMFIDGEPLIRFYVNTSGTVIKKQLKKKSEKVTKD